MNHIIQLSTKLASTVKQDRNQVSQVFHKITIFRRMWQKFGLPCNLVTLISPAGTYPLSPAPRASQDWSPISSRLPQYFLISPVTGFPSFCFRSLQPSFICPLPPPFFIASFCFLLRRTYLCLCCQEDPSPLNFSGHSPPRSTVALSRVGLC